MWAQRFGSGSLFLSKPGSSCEYTQSHSDTMTVSTQWNLVVTANDRRPDEQNRLFGVVDVVARQSTGKVKKSTALRAIRRFITIDYTMDMEETTPADDFLDHEPSKQEKVEVGCEKNISRRNLASPEEGIVATIPSSTNPTERAT